MKYIPTLIPSLDRACQLRLLLESISRNAYDQLFDITVLYSGSDEDFIKGYRQLMVETDRVIPSHKIQFVWQDSFGENFHKWVSDLQSNLCCFFVDDCIFYRKMWNRPETIEEIMGDPEVFCYSMRLGENTTLQNHKLNLFQKKFEGLDWRSSYSSYKWEWARHNPDYNYGYYWSWDGVFYRSSDMKEMVGDEKSLKNPRAVETHMYHRPRKYTHMTCPKKSSVVCMEWNCVQDDMGYYGGWVRAMPRDLNKAYLNGFAIDMDTMDFSDIRSCHYEIPFGMKAI